MSRDKVNPNELTKAIHTLFRSVDRSYYIPGLVEQVFPISDDLYRPEVKVPYALRGIGYQKPDSYAYPELFLLLLARDYKLALNGQGEECSFLNNPLIPLSNEKKKKLLASAEDDLWNESNANLFEHIEVTLNKRRSLMIRLLSDAMLDEIARKT